MKIISFFIYIIKRSMKDRKDILGFSTHLLFIRKNNFNFF